VPRGSGCGAGRSDVADVDADAADAATDAVVAFSLSRALDADFAAADAGAGAGAVADEVPWACERASGATLRPADEAECGRTLWPLPCLVAADGDGDAADICSGSTPDGAISPRAHCLMLNFCGCACICGCAALESRALRGRSATSGVDIGGVTTTDIGALVQETVTLLLGTLLETLPDVLLDVLAVAGRTMTALRLYSLASPADAMREWRCAIEKAPPPLWLCWWLARPPRAFDMVCRGRGDGRQHCSRARKLPQKSSVHANEFK
jgi:hypothetical protein